MPLGAEFRPHGYVPPAGNEWRAGRQLAGDVTEDRNFAGARRVARRSTRHRSRGWSARARRSQGLGRELSRWRALRTRRSWSREAGPGGFENGQGDPIRWRYGEIVPVRPGQNRGDCGRRRRRS